MSAPSLACWNSWTRPYGQGQAASAGSLIRQDPKESGEVAVVPRLRAHERGAERSTVNPVLIQPGRNAGCSRVSSDHASCESRSRQRPDGPGIEAGAGPRRRDSPGKGRGRPGRYPDCRPFTEWSAFRRRSGSQPRSVGFRGSTGSTTHLVTAPEGGRASRCGRVIDDAVRRARSPGSTGQPQARQHHACQTTARDLGWRRHVCPARSAAAAAIAPRCARSCSAGRSATAAAQPCAGSGPASLRRCGCMQQGGGGLRSRLLRR